MKFLLFFRKLIIFFSRLGSHFVTYTYIKPKNSFKIKKPFIPNLNHLKGLMTDPSSLPHPRLQQLQKHLTAFISNFSIL